ncbi:hypothetical protein [Parabacteroides pacaensis]|uniref:hypothetical protein n=1 Tax=Parabacteroides pacaensis TaxID=2086575 RepID=UPI000D0F6927|nr:hypothetical protein [Parabacteroides pacaensis]
MLLFILLVYHAVFGVILLYPFLPGFRYARSACHFIPSCHPEYPFLQKGNQVDNDKPFRPEPHLPTSVMAANDPLSSFGEVRLC